MNVDMTGVTLKPLKKKEKEAPAFWHQREEGIEITFGKGGSSYFTIDALGVIHDFYVNDERALEDDVTLADLVEGYQKSKKK
jgi:hypothetical protein